MTKIDVSYFDKMRKPPRPIRIDGDVAYITLTQGMYAIVDTVDAHEISRLNWIAMGFMLNVTLAHMKGKELHY